MESHAINSSSIEATLASVENSPEKSKWEKWVRDKVATYVRLSDDDIKEKQKEVILNPIREALKKQKHQQG